MFYIKFHSGVITEVWDTPFRTKEEAEKEIELMITRYGYQKTELSVMYRD